MSKRVLETYIINKVIRKKKCIYTKEKHFIRNKLKNLLLDVKKYSLYNKHPTITVSAILLLNQKKKKYSSCTILAIICMMKASIMLRKYCYN